MVKYAYPSVDDDHRIVEVSDIYKCENWCIFENYTFDHFGIAHLIGGVYVDDTYTT